MLPQQETCSALFVVLLLFINLQHSCLYHDMSSTYKEMDAAFTKVIHICPPKCMYHFYKKAEQVFTTCIFGQQAPVAICFFLHFFFFSFLYSCTSVKTTDSILYTLLFVSCGSNKRTGLSIDSPFSFSNNRRLSNATTTSKF